MAQLNTRIILRNDTSAAWLSNAHQILAKGEVGIEFIPGATNDYKVKLKIGDGVNSWANLPYFGNEIEYNEKAFAIADGKLDLLGLAAAEVGAQLVKGEDGSLSWVKPDTTTVEGLATTVETLLNTINGTVDENGNSNNDGLIHRVANLETKEDTNTEKITGIETSVKELETQLANTYSKEETNTAIAEAITAIDHLKRVIISVEELESLKANPASAEKNTIYMVKKDGATQDAYYEYMRFDADSGEVTFEQIGDTSVDLTDYAKTSEVEAIVNEQVEKIDNKFNARIFEFTDVPKGTLVNYSDTEIRVMCPVGTEWTKQSVGAGGDPDSYYGTLRVYAPSDEAVGYIEHLGTQSDAEILTSFSVDKYGRRYQPSWLALAKYDASTDTWNYYGQQSTTERYIGWNYQIDWYNAEGIMIASDSIRINLANENCHFVNEPYFMGTINVNKLVQNENDVLILYGGSASDNI